MSNVVSFRDRRPFEDAAADMVLEFIETMGATRNAQRNVELLNDELLEFEQAKADLLKEACDVVYTAFCVGHSDGKPAFDDDTKAYIGRVVTLVTAMFGRSAFQEAFRRVHASNMSKVGPDGKPIKDATGKIMKGPNYQKPDLTDLVS
jgi:predicted HAD superfamily Cof-like phosphohydrolase